MHLDLVARRYGVRPSQLLKQGSLDDYNFDKHVAGLAVKKEAENISRTKGG